MILEHGPTHTKDISQAKADLSKFGYCIIPEVLSDSEIEISKKRLLEQAEAEEELGLSFRDGGADQEIKLKDGRVDKDSFSTKNGGVNQRLWMRFWQITCGVIARQDNLLPSRTLQRICAQALNPVREL